MLLSLPSFILEVKNSNSFIFNFKHKEVINTLDLLFGVKIGLVMV